MYRKILLILGVVLMTTASYPQKTIEAQVPEFATSLEKEYSKLEDVYC